jgi:hypothetical protein
MSVFAWIQQLTVTIGPPFEQRSFLDQVGRRLHCISASASRSLCFRAS